MSLAEALKKLPNYYEQELLASEEDLNDLSEKEGVRYDPTKYFRDKVIKEGFRIKSLSARYYQGWEMDEWTAIAEKDGKRYKLSTDHGGLCFELLETI